MKLKNIRLKTLAIHALKVILATYPIGISLRFIVEFFRNGIYKPCLLDVLFDWIGLLISGLVFLNIVIKQYFNEIRGD